MERAVTYSVVARKKPNDLEGSAKYYALAQARGEMGIREMADRIQQMCTVTRADTLAVLVALEEEVCRGLCNGEIVRLGELGSLQVGVKSEGVRLEADFHESMINKIWVRFRPGMVLKGMLDGAAFERVSPRKEAGRVGKGMRYERE